MQLYDYEQSDETEAMKVLIDALIEAKIETEAIRAGHCFHNADYIRDAFMQKDLAKALMDGDFSWLAGDDDEFIQGWVCDMETEIEGINENHESADDAQEAVGQWIYEQVEYYGSFNEWSK